MDEEYVKKLVIERLRTIPPNQSFSIIGYGRFSRDDLIREVMNDSPLGRQKIESELRFLRAMPNIVNRLQTQ